MLSWRLMKKSSRQDSLITHQFPLSGKKSLSTNSRWNVAIIALRRWPQWWKTLILVKINFANSEKVVAVKRLQMLTLMCKFWPLEHGLLCTIRSVRFPENSKAALVSLNCGIRVSTIADSSNGFLRMVLSKFILHLLLISVQRSTSSLLMSSKQHFLPFSKEPNQSQSSKWNQSLTCLMIISELRWCGYVTLKEVF